MQTTNHPRRRIMIQLSSFDQVIKDLLVKYPAYRLEETKHPTFLPGLYQLLANEIAYRPYRNNVMSAYSTRAFRNAYLYEDRCELIDELSCKVRDIILTHFGVNRLKHLIKIELVSYNVWCVEYFAGDLNEKVQPRCINVSNTAE